MNIFYIIGNIFYNLPAIFRNEYPALLAKREFFSSAQAELNVVNLRLKAFHNPAQRIALGKECTSFPFAP